MILIKRILAWYSIFINSIHKKNGDQKVGVIGAGVMGCGVAMTCALAGRPVVLFDADPVALQRALRRLADLTQGLSRRGVTEERLTRASSSISVADDLQALRVCAVVVEAIHEQLEAKRTLMRRLGGVLPADALIATNTSSLCVGDIASAAARPERVVGTHFFIPAHINALVEVVAARQTSPLSIEQAAAFCGELGKQVVFCRDTPGFIVNRIYLLLINEAARIVDEGLASAQVVDRVARETFGARIGPLAVCDQTNPRTTVDSLRGLAPLGAAYFPADGLLDRASTPAPWVVPGTSDTLPSAALAQVLRQRLLAAVLWPSQQLIAQQLATAQDIDLAVRTALRFDVTPSAAAHLVDAVAGPQALAALAKRGIAAAAVSSTSNTTTSH